MAARGAGNPARLSRDAWVREAPSASAAPLGLARRGSALPCVGRTPRGDWLAVNWRGRLGWVSGRFAGRRNRRETPME